IAEAKRTSAYLENEEEDSLLILAKDLGLDSFSENEGTLTVDIVHYLTFAPKDVHYKLIGREISNGRVVINTHERIRLIEEAVKKYAEKLPAAQALPPVIKKYAEKLQALLPKIEPQKLSFKQGENPPCIEALLEMFRKHENIGHTGRWLLAVYLINKGMKTQDMLAIFSNAPDYNERIATYQIEHARKRGYKMPKCSSLVGYGYCVANCGIKNPMGWKRRKGA
ncbi:hypothetical protein KJ780_00535, partial [Candidatus Micrarchaeota archaeon]|nr:hypothetical protein [Candidatus Micrarchaeota archaeon]